MPAASMVLYTCIFPYRRRPPPLPPPPLLFVCEDMAGDAGRVRKELAECARDTESGVTAKPKGDSLASLEGTILGPEVR